MNETDSTPRALSITTLILIGLALFKLFLHFYVNTFTAYGYFRDELYFLICGERLDWGYVDHAPLIAVYAAASRWLLGDSLFAIRFLPAMAGAAKVLLAGLLARELGGKRFAQVLAGVAVIVAPIYLGIDNMLTMNVFEPLYWMGCAYIAVRIFNGASPKLWLLFGVLAGLGLENKHSTLFFGFAFFIGLLLTAQRRAFREPWIWLGGASAFLIFLPNLYWQYKHGFPTVELLRNVAASGRNVSLNPLEFISQQVLMMNPFAAPVWLAGLGHFFFRKEGKPYRVLGWTWMSLLACFLLMNGRVYYLAPAFPMLFAAGGVFFEQFFEPVRRAWMKPVYVSLLTVSGAVLAPMALPLLPVETFISYSQKLHLGPPPTETHRLGRLPQLYADMHGWPEMASTVAEIYKKIPPLERGRCAVFAQNYGQAAAIDFFGREYSLPYAISGHQNYFFWGPRKYTGECVIVLDDDRETLEGFFEEVEQVAVVSHPYSMPYEHWRVHLCRKPKFGKLRDVWPQLKKWN